MEILIIVTLLVIAAETTYLVVAQKMKMKYSLKNQTPIFVDTSVLIDGRIIAVASSGFVTGTLFIPRSVVGELQFLADNADPEKRSRARHGLDIVSELQGLTTVKTEIYVDSTKADEGVDNRLLELAKKHNGVICTIDYNLNKVAQVEGIGVLNVNDLAMSLRMAYLPGEKIMLELTHKGNDSHQAIGHLTDGTMVVVEHAISMLGKKVEVEFIRSLQTAAGKMMFARLVGATKSQKAQKQQKKEQASTPALVQAKQPRANRNQSKSRTQQKQQDQPETEARDQAQQRVEAPVQQAPKQRQLRQDGQAKTKPVGRAPQNNRRRQTNEDRLVELANSQE